MSARTFALLCGLLYAGLGVLETLPLVSPLVAAVHLGVGAWGLAAWGSAASPIKYARAATVIFTALAVVGLIPGLHPYLGLLPIEGRDVWLHLLSALVAAYFGFRQARGDRRFGARDRRRKSRAPAANERRQGYYERRRSPYAA